MKVLLFGQTGQVGREVKDALLASYELITLNRLDVNFEKKTEIERVIELHKPDLIVNAAAYTAVDKAEHEKKKVFQINSVAVEAIAKMAKKMDVWFIHYSSDYVFDGKNKNAYLESDAPAPKSIYGQSKLDGEKAIIESGCKYVIFRTSWIYNDIGSNFVKTILKLAREKKSIEVVDDQWGSPTSAPSIAKITALCIAQIKEDKFKSGIYHLSNRGETSWHLFAKFILNEAEKLGYQSLLKAEKIKPIKTKDYLYDAERPLNSRLNCAKLESQLRIELPSWKIEAQKIILKLIQK
ncbi:MAG: dTDP-4-dehydrorhamnose reductase [Candidatus Methylopumilus sp.]|nr:dTDP-4-dehydrorhamnose reductase [Candidatus Methylopumilus sp.]